MADREIKEPMARSATARASTRLTMRLTPVELAAVTMFRQFPHTPETIDTDLTMAEVALVTNMQSRQDARPIALAVQSAAAGRFEDASAASGYYARLDSGAMWSEHAPADLTPQGQAALGAAAGQAKMRKEQASRAMTEEDRMPPTLETRGWEHLGRLYRDAVDAAATLTVLTRRIHDAMRHAGLTGSVILDVAPDRSGKPAARVRLDLGGRS